MTGEFRVSINLGNDAMRKAEDVAEALEKVAKKLREQAVAGTISDRNGNYVGQFLSDGLD